MLEFSEIGAGVIDFIPPYDRMTTTQYMRNPNSPFFIDTVETTMYTLGGILLRAGVENNDMIARPIFAKRRRRLRRKTQCSRSCKER
jgi:hypothetical protein